MPKLMFSYLVLPMCITHKPCSYVCWCIHCLCHLHDLVTGDVKRKEGWLELSPITEGCASEELFFLSRTPYLDRNRCDAFLIMLESPLILYERCLFNDAITDYRWYISMCWKYYLKIYNLGYDIACDVLQAQPWLTFRPSAFFMRTEHRLPENAQLGISSLVA